MRASRAIVHRLHRCRPIGERHRAGPAAMQVRGAELEAGGRKGLGGIDEHDFFQADAGGFDIAQAGTGPEVIDCRV